jgi:hypothetical protein
MFRFYLKILLEMLFYEHLASYAPVLVDIGSETHVGIPVVSVTSVRF